MTDADHAFLRKVIILAAVAATVLVLWTLRYVLLLLFNAVLVALFLQALYAPLARLGLDRRAGLAIVVLALAVAVGLGGAFFGWKIEQQAAEAIQLLPQALADLQQNLQSTDLGSKIVSGASSFNLSLQSALPALMHLPGYAVSTAQVVADVLIVVFGGLFIAATPHGYFRGAVALTPASWRGRLGPFLDDTGSLLRRWLIAQLIAMVTVGLLTGLGLAVIGVPAAGALGLFAAAAEFVPIAGPIAAAIPALLLASLHGLGKTGWTLLLFVVVQQFESNLLIPLLQRRIVHLRPLLVLFSLMAFEVLFGFLGILLAIPLTIVAKTALERFYIDTQGAGPHAPGGLQGLSPRADG
ncbi:MAG TPA: AI-2E family transporter [Caulobacteraceae bacterium]|jgi:predicted PurR-regulated permease PerM